MQTIRHPYELLVRWAPDGTLAGAHVQWRYVVTDGENTLITETLSPALPLAAGLADGFPAAGILDGTAITALCCPAGQSEGL